MNGKGDTPRPLSIPREEYERKWEAIFRPVPPPPPDKNT